MHNDIQIYSLQTEVLTYREEKKNPLVILFKKKKLYYG